MTDIKISEQMAQLIDHAKQIGERGNPPLTAERFLVALINNMESYQDADGKMDLSGELLIASKVFFKNVKDMDVAKKTLMAYISEDRLTFFLDDLYMKKRMQEAADMVRIDGGDLTPAAVLVYIFETPSDVIATIMSRKPITSAEEPEEKDESQSNPEEKRIKFEDIISCLADADEDMIEIPEEESDDDFVFEEKSVKSAMADLVKDVKRIRTELKDRIFGQDNAINVFATGYFQAKLLSLIDKSKKRPSATFLFAGPPGVGKTFMAEEAARSLKLPFKRFDMSEYSDKEANIEFCGSDKVYKNGKAGNVTSFVAENPRCVLLFDEIEKAHINVIHLFLQMLDAGRLRDNYTDEEVSFSEAVIIMTTNAGKQLYEESESGDLSVVSRKVVIRALQRDVNPATGSPYFPGAICSRFASGNVVMFNHIGAHNLRGIAKREIERHAQNFERETEIKIIVDERVYTALLFAEGSAADARTIRSRAESFFNNELYELLRLIASDKVKTDIENIERIKIGIDLKNTEDSICELFEPANKTKILTFAAKDVVSVCESKIADVEFVGAQDVQDAVNIMKNQHVDFVLLDMKCGAPAAASAKLNIEDVESPARDFFKILREQRKDLPLYLLETRNAALSDEEIVSFTAQGVRGVLRIARGKDSFAEKIGQIASILHQQASMIKLAKENKVVSFETAQTVSKNGKYASIKLFDLEMTTAVDSEDAKNILSAVSKPDVRFDDVIGARDAKKELKYFVEYLKNPKKYMGSGVKVPKGVILYGPPGTGKTMLAKAMACEAGVTFIAAEGNQFLKRFVGEGSEKVHELFKTARKYAPSILFVDEIDAIGKERRGGTNAGGGGEETLTAFLTEMDGFVNDPSRPVFVLAATNFDVEPGSSKSLDPALMRRFDRRVYIDLPNKADRITFLKKKIAENHALDISPEQIDNISMRSTGMSLAELDSVVELALRSAIREGSTKVNDAILEEAFETFNSGEVKKWDATQLERVARHEAGHALLCYLAGETPSYLTIVARGNHGGYMQHAEQEGKAIFTKDELLCRIRTSLGGRAAEIAYYGIKDGISTGASGDLVTATNIAQQIVCAYGMDDDFGLAVVPGAIAGNGTMSVEVRAAVNRILNEQMLEAVKLITENKDKIDSLVEELMTNNHLNSAQIEQAIKKCRDAETAAE